MKFVFNFKPIEIAHCECNKIRKPKRKEKKILIIIHNNERNYIQLRIIINNEHFVI